MAKKRLPIKPNTATRYSFNEKEKLALCCYCMLECSKQTAFSLAHPELSGTPNILKRKTDEFFMSSDAVGFITEYRAFLEAETEVKVVAPEKTITFSAEAREERKRKALELLDDDLVDQIYALRNGDGGVDRETILKMVDRIGWLGDEKIRVEQPRRYLPESCGTCKYKLWIEENCEITDNN